MKKDVKNKQAIFPMPVLMIATYNDDDNVDVMNAAWGTMLSMDSVALNLDENHKTVKNIKKRKAFTVGLADKDHMVQADYVGVVSANNVPDKFEKSGLHFTKSKNVDAPVIDEWPVSLECEFIEYQDDETGIGVIGKVVNVVANEEVVDEKGLVDVSKLNALIFDPFGHNYFVVGEKVGNAFQEGQKLK